MEENRKYSLLIVDDEPVISDGIKELFEENFGSVFQIYHCYHPKKALEISARVSKRVKDQRVESIVKD